MSGGWNTIESDAGVFTYLIERLGVTGVQFEELITLDADSLRQLGQVYGIIFLFKYPRQTPSAAALDPTHTDGSLDHEAAETHFFASQVIQNACGTQAILSILLNHADSPGVSLGPHLRDFLDFTAGFDPALRGEALSNSEHISATHNSFARASPFIDESSRPDTEDDDDGLYHFIAYTALAGTLYELDGLRAAPVSHGACDGLAEFPEKVVPVLQRRMQRYPEGEIRFNVMALAADPRPAAREAGDWEALRREEAKRRAWVWENALRRCNFLGFAKEVLQGVVAAKMDAGGEAEVAGWIEAAKGETKRKVEEQRKRKKTGGLSNADGMDLGLR